MGSCCVAQKKKKPGQQTNIKLSGHNPQWGPIDPSRQFEQSYPEDKQPIEPIGESKLSFEDQELRRRQLAEAAEARIRTHNVQGFSKAGYVDYQYKKRAAERVANAPVDQKLLTFKMG